MGDDLYVAIQLRTNFNEEAMSEDELKFFCAFFEEILLEFHRMLEQDHGNES